jgi:hypothetical protein
MLITVDCVRNSDWQMLQLNLVKIREEQNDVVWWNKHIYINSEFFEESKEGYSFFV